MGGDDELGSLSGLDQQFGDHGNDVWVEADLRLFDENQRRRCGMTQKRQETEIPKCAIREARQGDKTLGILDDVNLNEAADDSDSNVLCPLVQLLEKANDRFVS